MEKNLCYGVVFILEEAKERGKKGNGYINKENREGHEPTEGPGGPGREARVLLSLSSAAGVWPEGGGRRPLER